VVWITAIIQFSLVRVVIVVMNIKLLLMCVWFMLHKFSLQLAKMSLF